MAKTLTRTATLEKILRDRFDEHFLENLDQKHGTEEGMDEALAEHSENPVPDSFLPAVNIFAAIDYDMKPLLAVSGKHSIFLHAQIRAKNSTKYAASLKKLLPDSNDGLTLVTPSTDPNFPSQLHKAITHYTRSSALDVDMTKINSGLYEITLSGADKTAKVTLLRPIANESGVLLSGERATQAFYSKIEYFSLSGTTVGATRLATEVFNALSYYDPNNDTNSIPSRENLRHLQNTLGLINDCPAIRAACAREDTFYSTPKEYVIYKLVVADRHNNGKLLVEPMFGKRNNMGYDERLVQLTQLCVPQKIGPVWNRFVPEHPFAESEINNCKIEFRKARNYMKNR